MANICTNQITFIASKDAIDWLESEINKLNELSYNERPKKLIDMFGVQGDNNIDRVGSKWITLDSGERYREDDNTYFLQLESANYPPDELIKNIVKLLQDKSVDESVSAQGKYWDEGFDPIGILECNSTGYYTDETTVDVDWDNEYYWDEQVEPAFDKLEL